MKKWIFIFLSAYLLFGLFLFFKDDKTEKPADVAGSSNQAESIHMRWIVNDPDNSNYRPPQWLTNKKVEKYVDSIHDSETVEATEPDYQLMTLFAQAQLGEARFISSFVNPMISFEDFPSVDPDDMDKQSEQYVKMITKDRSFAEVRLSSPKSDTSEKVVFDVTLIYDDQSHITLTDIPMVKMGEEVNWFLDITLTQLADRVGLAQKTTRMQ